MVNPETSAGVALSLFERNVKQALRLFDDPERLGQESPLASLYVLGRALREAPRPTTSRVRGEVLRGEIRAAAQRLWRGELPRSRAEMLDAITEIRRDPDDPRYAYVVLELRCFNDFVRPNRTSDIWEQPHLLPGSKSQHYRDFDAAVKLLAGVLLDSLRPAVRAERPRPPAALYGYERQIESLVDALARGGSVALTGPGGVGKTSVGATAVERLRERGSFWYTVRPGFNDGTNSLLYALGAFLHERSAPNLWQYLVVANGVANDLNLAAGLLRQDLASFGESQPVIVLDDLEHLATGSLGLLNPAHAQLLDLIESLRGAAPLLLISQRPLPPSDLHLELGGLRPEAVEQLWRAAGQHLDAVTAARLHTYTGGNPRLLNLMLAFQADGGEGEPVLDEDGAAPSLLPAFQRLWRRLTPEERRALQWLSVYQGYAPEDVLEPALLESLARLHLVERDGEGGVSLLPALAPVIQADLSPERRETLHAEAAIVRLERGEYTAAAYHFVQSSQEALAVQAWYPQRRQAIARGEADAARRIFSEVSRQRLAGPERKALDLIRAELRHLAGQSAEALRELEQLDWSEESEAGARLWMLRGDLEEALGFPDQALRSYAEGLHVTARLLGQLTTLHQRRGMLYQRRREHSASWAEVYRGEVSIELLRGLLREDEGDYPTSLEAYQRARALAEQLGDDALLAYVERRISIVHGRRQQLDEAIAHANRAITIYQRLGDRLNQEKMRSNLAFIYVQTRQFRAALEAGAPAYEFFVAMRDSYSAAGTGANLAEASFELGDLAGAARYANEVLALGDRFAAPYARFTLGQIALAEGKPAAAVREFGESMELAQASHDPYMVAYARRALGQAHAAAGAAAAAREQIAGALASFRQLDIPGEIAATERLLAELDTGR